MLTKLPFIGAALSRCVAIWRSEGFKRWRAPAVAGLVLSIVGSAMVWHSFAAVPPSACDLNGDGVINITDLSILLSSFGKSATGPVDINGDGKVTITDLSLLLTNYGKTVPTPTPTPTPPPPTPTPTPTPPPPPTPTPTPPPPTPTPTPPPPVSGAAPGISKGMVEDSNGNNAQDATDMQTLGVKWDRGWLECGGGSGATGFAKGLQDKGVTFLPTYNCGINTSIATYKSQLANDMKALMPYGVHVWEIGNEMDGGWTADNNYCGNNSTPGNMTCAEQAYLPFLQAAFETIHANDPAGVVMYGGLSSYDVNLGPWLKAMTDSKAWQYMDAMGFHPYGNSVAESMASMDTLYSYMSKDPTWSTKPIWITEYGCWSSGFTNQNSPCSPGSEAGKASYLTGMLNGLKAWHKGTSFEIRSPICWYILHESGSTPGYGLTQLTNPRTYFTAFTTYKNYVF